VDKCTHCPLLLANAEMQAMMQAGVGLGHMADTRPLLIGRLRDKYGCPGPHRSGCWWREATHWGIDTMSDVPILDGFASRDTGQYL
jgi:hypothetical protein